MKLRQPFILLLAIVISVTSSHAQDLHKTLYNMMPLSVNPAYAGDFEGSFRIAGMYKDQHSSTFRTPSISLDVPALMVRKRDWVSVGISLDRDVAGDADLSITRQAYTVSYHLALDKKGNDYFVAGYQFGSDTRRINNNKLLFGDGNDPNKENLPEKVSTNINNFGILYRSQIDKNTLLNIGATYLYIIRQNSSISSSGSTEKRPSAFTIHGLIDRNIDKKLSIHPSFIIRNRGYEGTEVMIQAMGGYLFSEELDLRLKGGIGYDLDQGPAILLGADYGDWKFGLSFEIPLYGVAEATNFGGFEISANKIIKIYKKPVVEPAVCCPDL